MTEDICLTIAYIRICVIVLSKTKYRNLMLYDTHNINSYVPFVIVIARSYQLCNNKCFRASLEHQLDINKDRYLFYFKNSS